MLIKLELECTPLELIGIGQVMEGHTPVVLDTPVTRGELPAAEAEEIVITRDVAEHRGVESLVDAVVDVLTPASPAADAFAAGVEEAPEKPVTIETSPAASVPQNTNDLAEAVELAKGTNGQMIPWDARIHGKAKKQNADGSWRLVQGVDRDTLVPQVEAELVTALTAPKPADVATVPSPEQAPTTQQSPAAVTTTAPDAAPSVPNPPNATAKPTTFPELLPLVTAAKAAGTLTDETIANACAELGLATFGLIATRPDLIPRAAELLGV